MEKSATNLIIGVWLAFYWRYQAMLRTEKQLTNHNAHIGGELKLHNPPPAKESNFTRIPI